MLVLTYFITIGILVVAAIRKPAIGLSFLLSTFAVEQWLQSKDMFFIHNNRLVNISSAIIVLTALVSKIVKEKNVLKNYPVVGVLTVILYLYAFISILWVNDPSLSFKVYFKYLPYTVPIVILSPLLVSSVKDIREFLHTLWGFGVFLAVVFMFFTDWSYRHVVLAGGYEMVTNPLAIASFFGYIILLSMFLENKSKLRYLFIVKWVVVGICLILIVKSGSRGQFLFVLFVTLIMYSLRRSLSIKNTVIVGFVSILVLAAGFIIFQEYSGGDARWESSQLDSDLAGRFDGARQLLGVWFSNPINILLGLGSSASYDSSILGFYPHVVPLEILGEEGLIGFGIFIAILVFSLRSFRKSMRLTRTNVQYRSLIVSVGAMALYDLMLSFKQGSFLGSPNLFCLMILLTKAELIIANEKRLEPVVPDINDSAAMAAKKTPQGRYVGVKLRS